MGAPLSLREIQAVEQAILNMPERVSSVSPSDGLALQKAGNWNAQQGYEPFYSIPGEQWDLRKAIEAQEREPDISKLQDYGAGQYQTLENTFASVLMNSDEYQMLKGMPMSKTTTLMVQYAREMGIGGNLFGQFVGQMESAEVHDPKAKREYENIVFMRDSYRAGDVAEQQGGMLSAMDWARKSCIHRMTRALNLASLFGRSDIIPTSFDGIDRAIRNKAPEMIIDCRGYTPNIDQFNQLTQKMVDNLAMIQEMQTAAYMTTNGVQALVRMMRDSDSDPNTRYVFAMNQGGGNTITTGARVMGIATQFGSLKPIYDLSIPLGMERYQETYVHSEYDRGILIPGKESPNAPSPPQSVTLTVNAPPIAGSLFADGEIRPSGTKQRYKIVSRNRWGRGMASVMYETSANVLEGGSVTITIVPSPNDTYRTEGFAILGERVYESNVFSIIDEVRAIASTVYEDKNIRIPGTTNIYILPWQGQGARRNFNLYEFGRGMEDKRLASTGPHEGGLITKAVAPVYYAPERFGMLTNVPISNEAGGNRFISV